MCVLKYAGPHYIASAQASIPFLKVAMQLAYSTSHLNKTQEYETDDLLRS